MSTSTQGLHTRTAGNIPPFEPRELLRGQDLLRSCSALCTPPDVYILFCLNGYARPSSQDPEVKIELDHCKTGVKDAWAEWRTSRRNLRGAADESVSTSDVK